MKLVLQRMCAEAGVQLLLHAEVEQVHVKGERLSAVRVSSVSGIEFLAAECFVDATATRTWRTCAACPGRRGARRTAAASR